MTYKVARCPRCQKPQLTTANKTFGCKYCGKSSNITGMDVLFFSNSHREALNFLYKLYPPQP